MEYKNETYAESYKHIIPLFSALDSSDEEGSRVYSSCERPCVCVCVCRHGKASSMDFSKQEGLEKDIEELFDESLTAQSFYKT